MESIGVIFKILDAVSGTSQRTGNPWKAQSFVIEVSSGEHGQYKKKQVFEIFGDDRIREANLKEGDAVKVSFDLEAREYEGKWYNSARVYKVEHITQTQGYQQRPPQNPYPQQRPPQNGFYQPVQQGYPQPPEYYQQNPPYQPQGGYPQGGYPQGVGGNDDLPF